MCIAFISYQKHQNYPLIIVGNRDEFYNRPTKALHIQEINGIPFFAGKDKKEGGVWLAADQLGNVCLITNYRHPKLENAAKKSRGLIGKKFIECQNKPEVFTEFLKSESEHFRPFNFIFGNSKKLYYFNNIHREMVLLAPGNYALSNAFLDTPWPKVEQGKKQFSKILSGPNLEYFDFLKLLSNTETYQDARLPDTGIGLDWERKLASIFIKSEQYGTVSSSFFIQRESGTLIYEKNYLLGVSTGFAF